MRRVAVRVCPAPLIIMQIKKDIKEKFLRVWEKERVDKLSEEQKDNIITLFYNKRQCLKRDNHECQNEYCSHEYPAQLSLRKEYMSIHHIVPKKDFKENPTLEKHLGYGVHELINLITLCKPCHQSYEKAKLTICLKGVEYKRDSPESINLKQLTKEARKMRKSLKQLGVYGWGRMSDDERLDLILLLMKWLSKEYVDWAEYENDDY